MMIIDGQEINTLEELENAIASMSEENKMALRGIFNSSEPPLPTQKQLDYNKYLKRAAAKDIILAEMASENMERVRNGIWTVSDLVSLTQDAELKLVLDDINTLSFELAQSKLNTINNPLLVPEIKNGWINKLQTHLYNG